MNKAFIILLLILTVFLVSCATTQNDYTRSFYVKAQSAPQDPEIIYGIGQGETIDIARNQAVTDIARQIETRVDFQSSLKIKSSTVGGETENSESFSQESTLLTDVIINDAVRVEDFITLEGYSYTMMMLSGNDALYDPGDVSEIINTKSRNRKILSTVMSGIAPGTGQLKDGYYGAGTSFLAPAAALAVTAVSSFIAMNYYNDQYQSARNNTERDHYYSYAQAFSTTGIITSAAYGITGIISAIDVWGAGRP